MSLRTRLVAATAVTTAVAGLAACSGSDEPSADPTSTTPTSEAPTTAIETPPSSYLPVPVGVTLTEPGTQLPLKSPATVAWTPRQDLVGVVDVAVTRIERTTVADSLAGFDLSAAEETATPYFVHTRVTNVGDTDLGARQLPVYVEDSRSALVAPTGIAPDFEPCPGSTLPAVFAPGDEARSCLIFLVPAGAEPRSVMVRPPEGVVPITWTGEVRDLKPDRPRRARD